MQRICLLVVLFSISLTANGQGTPGVLRCSYKGSLDVHASRQPDSPIIARLNCGAAVLLIDDRFGSPHVRTEDGKDGFIVGLNLGQWSIEPEARLLNNAPAPNNVQPTATAPTAIVIQNPRPQTIAVDKNGTREALNGLRRTELFYAPLSYVRQSGTNFYGGDLALTFNVNPLFGIVADLGVYRSETIEETILGNEHLDAITYRFGPKFSTRPNERITLFGQILVGGSRVRETAAISGVQVSGPYSNGFIFHPSGGLDIALARWVGLRVEPGYNFHRIEGENSNGFQIAIGPVFRFAPR